MGAVVRWGVLSGGVLAALFIGLAVLGWIVTRGRSPPMGGLDNELKAIRAGARARETEAQLGSQAALAEVREEHRTELLKLDAEQAKKAEELRDDPVALSKFLVRSGRPMAHSGGSGT